MPKYLKGKDPFTNLVLSKILCTFELDMPKQKTKVVEGLA